MKTRTTIYLKRLVVAYVNAVLLTSGVDQLLSRERCDVSFDFEPALLQVYRLPLPLRHVLAVRVDKGNGDT